MKKNKKTTKKMESTLQQRDLAFKQINILDKWMLTCTILAPITGIAFTLAFIDNLVFYSIIMSGLYSFTLFIHNVYKQSRQALLDIAVKSF